jgi:hypothetical protein
MAVPPIYTSLHLMTTLPPVRSYLFWPVILAFAASCGLIGCQYKNEPLEGAQRCAPAGGKQCPDDYVCVQGFCKRGGDDPGNHDGDTGIGGTVGAPNGGAPNGGVMGGAPGSTGSGGMTSGDDGGVRSDGGATGTGAGVGGMTSTGGTGGSPDLATQCRNAAQKLCGTTCVPLGDPVTGCAEDTCQACPVVPNGTPSCQDNKCATTCDKGLGDCDGIGGCETQLNDDPKHCGRCERSCNFSDRCSAGACIKTSTPNLIVNPGAESGLDGWVATASAEVAMYGAPGVAGLNDPGPSDRGTHLFACPPVGNFSQEIDLFPFAAAIDSGRVVAEYSAYLGGVGASVDGASISLHILNASGILISAPYINGPNNVVRNGQTRLDLFSNSVVMPAGAKIIRLKLSCFGNQFELRGIADNLSLVLTGI